MTIAAFVPEFLLEYLRIIAPYAICAILVAGWFFLKRLPGGIYSRLSANWPKTDGRIETVKVTQVSEQALAELGYSYSVEGDRHSGYYFRQFGDEQHAWEFVDALRDQPIVVRYKRRNPEISALRNADQQGAVNLKGCGFLGSLFGSFLQAE
jgi:Protein of unknown function (DUF3592)